MKIPTVEQVELVRLRIGCKVPVGPVDHLDARPHPPSEREQAYARGQAEPGVRVPERQKNLVRLQQALEALNARRPDGQPLQVADLDPQRDGVVEMTNDAGTIKIVPQPAGTRGYDDLRRRANREPLGHGLRPQVANPADLVRMLEAREQAPDRLVLETMRRVLELERSLRLRR
ncbi:MAG TPA: hypothetical protein VGF23_03080 [Gaiellaceae bacterium]|jgi:hypothetical protein